VKKRTGTKKQRLKLPPGSSNRPRKFKIVEIGGVIVGIVALIVAGLGVWPEARNRVPFLPKPLLRISYQKQDKLVSVVVENIGNAEAGYITMDIHSKDGVFSLVDSHADFEISTSGKGGSWTVITARKILPQQRGRVTLELSRSDMMLEPPAVKSDSLHSFVGTINITLGPETSGLQRD